MTSRRDFVAASLGMAGTAACIRASHPTQSSRQQSPSHRQIFDAVIRGDLETTTRVLDLDPDLLAVRDADGRSLFAVALISRHADITALLRARGHQPDLHEAAMARDWDRLDALAAPDPLRVNDPHPIGGTAMYAAAAGGAGTDMWRVYQYCGDPNARVPARPSPLRAALEFPDLLTAELTAATLLGNNADPGSIEPDGRSPLHIAAARGSLTLTEMLIRKGADPAATDPTGRTPRDLADRLGHEAVVRLLENHRDIPRDYLHARRSRDVRGRPCTPPDWQGLSIVDRRSIVGASHGNLDAVRSEVAKDPRLVHAVATTDEAAIEAAAHTGRLPIAEFLLEHGAPYDMPTAAMRGDEATIRARIRENPLCVNERGAHDFALLWYPIIGGGNTAIARMLIDAGARVEDQHHLGTTALHWAASRGQIDLVELLIDSGADVNRVGRKFGGNAHTPLALAERSGHDRVVALLRERGAG